MPKFFLKGGRLGARKLLSLSQQREHRTFRLDYEYDIEYQTSSFLIAFSLRANSS